MEQNHSGSGDNIGGHKIKRQINMGKKSTYIEKENINQDAKKEEPIAKSISVNSGVPNSLSGKLAETPSGFFAHLFSLLPEPLNYLVALIILLGGGYVAYHYFMPPTAETEPLTETVPTPPAKVPTKVYVSGLIYIDGKAAKFDEVKRVRLRNKSDVNSAQIDGAGKYTFKNVTIPGNNKLVVEITFDDGTTVPTEEITLDPVNAEDNTIYLPDLGVERPRPAKAGKPAIKQTIVKILNQVNTGGGDNNANQK